MTIIPQLIVIPPLVHLSLFTTAVTFIFSIFVNHLDIITNELVVKVHFLHKGS